MKTIKLTILLAALVSAPAYAYHDTGGHGDSPEAQVDIKLNDSQQKALDELYEVFPSAGMLTSARGEINGRIQLQRSMTARQQETLQALYEAFPDYQSLSGALGKLDGHIDEKKGEVLAELHQNLSLPAFGGAEGEEAVVVEFADYQCGYCKRMFSVLRDENVRVKVVEFPILGEISRKAAQYALAAGKAEFIRRISHCPDGTARAAYRRSAGRDGGRNGAGYGKTKSRQRKRRDYQKNLTKISALRAYWACGERPF